MKIKTRKNQAPPIQTEALKRNNALETESQQQRAAGVRNERRTAKGCFYNPVSWEKKSWNCCSFGRMQLLEKYSTGEDSYHYLYHYAVAFGGNFLWKKRKTNNQNKLNCSGKIKKSSKHNGVAFQTVCP